MSAVETPRSQVIKEIRLTLADGIVDVELDPDHYNFAIDKAISRYRRRSDNALEEALIFIRLQPNVNDYTLPNEVQEVRKLYRRGVGAATIGGTDFNPFELAYYNIYILESGRIGGLATFDFFSQYQETFSRIFGGEYQFFWHHHSRKLTIIRRIHREEDVMVHVYLEKPEDVLLTDPYSRPWLRDYAIAQCKMILGEARSKYTSGLPGPGGNVTLNGEQLKAEAHEEFDKLENEIIRFSEGGTPYGFIIG